MPTPLGPSLQSRRLLHCLTIFADAGLPLAGFARRTASAPAWERDLCGVWHLRTTFLLQRVLCRGAECFHLVCCQTIPWSLQVGSCVLRAILGRCLRL